ncbi:MAG: hypothetical protein ABS81_25375 [Pseudonocardia sp. SCN 72-86]|nr:MAG: hypothetical protein ABS81_25375 [Pseudonocardia sp. SCN 72-86]
MTTTHHTTPVPVRDGQRVTTFARGPVLLVAAVVALALGVASDSTGWFFDELYFLAAGRDHLAWGYMDQPPLVPALAGLMDSLAPGSLVVFRLPVTLGAALAVVLAGAIARELGGRRSAQTLAAVAAAGSPLVLMSHWLATYTLDPLWWTATVWLVLRAARALHDDAHRRANLLLLAAGVVTGLSLNTKFLVPALWAALLVALAACGGPDRRLLRAPGLWGGLILAALMTVPTLLWQAAHGWPYLGMATVVRREADTPAGFVTGGLAMFGLVGVVLAVAAVVVALRRPGRIRWLVLALGLVLVAIAVAGGRSYYVLEVVPALVAVGAVVITATPRLRRTRTWFGVVGIVASVLIALVYLPVLPTALRPVPSLAEGAEATFRPAAAEIDRVWDGLPADQRARTAVVAQIYPLAATMDGYGTTPPAHSSHRGYGYFPPPPDSADAAFWVGVDPLPAAFRAGFATCTPQPVDGLRVELCTGRTAPWTQLLAPTI